MRRGLAIYAVFAYAFLHVPLLILAIFSFNSSKFAVWESFSLQWYRAVASDANLIESSLNSLIIAIVATVAATIIGTLAAYGLWKRGSGWLSGSLYLSLVTPEIVTGASLLALFQWIFRFADLRLGMHTVILAHVGFSLAYVVVVVLARLRSYDRTLEEAALDLGARPWRAFQGVTLPLCAPGIRAGAILVFVPCLGTYLTSDLLGGSKTVLIGNLVQNQFTASRDWPFGAALSLALMAIAMLLLFAARRRGEELL